MFTYKLKYMKKALITGINGQDGSYLAEFLLEKGYKVYGLERRNSSRERRNITEILDKIELIINKINLNTFTIYVKTENNMHF